MADFDLNMCDGLTLAYLGDSVMELYVREKLIKGGLSGAGELNERAHEYVRATRQAEAFRRIEALLSEEEAGIYRRGRNSGHTRNLPKSATVAEYRCATGFEALLGWLYLSGREERIGELLKTAYEAEDVPGSN